MLVVVLGIGLMIIMVVGVFGLEGIFWGEGIFYGGFDEEDIRG